MTFFCPVCWKEVKRENWRCPRCGANITEYERKGYEEKLINALNHPERETVGRAVWILGKLKSVKAIRPLKDLAERTDNPYLKIEILKSLDEIGTEGAVGLIARAAGSGMRVVRDRARELLKKRNEG